MKNLKRALCLALSSIMLMGMMVVGTGAGYADVDSSDNKVAIDVLKVVGVMEGDENGNFNPDNMVTRNEMAVVMTKLLGLKAGGTSPFTDVPAWAQPYVAACYNNGVIAGISATEFGGSNNVTAAQAGLMVMKTLGYFGFQGEFGDDWKVATVKQATKIDLFNNMNVYTDEALTRNEVAQLVLNALEADIMVVEETGGLSVEGNGISVNQKPSYSYAYADDKAGHNYDGGADDRVLQLCEKLYGADLKKVIGGEPDAFGRPADTWTFKGETVKAAVAPTLVYTTGVKGKAVYADLGKPSLPTTGSYAYAVNSFVDGYQVAADTYITGNVNTNITDSAKGAVTEIFLDTDNRVLTTVITKYYHAVAAEDYNEQDKNIDIDVLVNGSTVTVTLSSEDWDNLESIKKDDNMVVTLTRDDSAYTTISVETVAMADVVKAAVVTEARNTDYVVAGGTKYTYSDVAEGNSISVGYNFMNNSAAYTMGKKCDLVLDPNGYVLGINYTAAKFDLSNYLFLKEAGQSGFDKVAKVMFSDGTTKTITVATYNDPDDADALTSGTYNSYCSFETNKDGSYDLTTVAAPGAAKVAQLNEGADNSDDLNLINSGPTNYYANADTVYVAKKAVSVGFKNAPKSAGSLGGYYLLDDTNSVVMAYFPSTGSLAANQELVYVINNTPAKGEDADEVTYYTYTVLMNGEKTTLSTKNSSLNVGEVYYIDEYVDSYAKLVSATAAEHVFGNAEARGTFTGVKHVAGNFVSNEATYVLAKDVVIYNIDNDTPSVKTINASGIENAYKNGYDAFVYVMNKDNDEITALYMWRT